MKQRNRWLCVIVSAFMSLSFCISTVITSFAVETIDTPNNNCSDSDEDYWRNKVQPYLLRKMHEMEEDERISVWLWMKDISEETVESEVYRRTGLSEYNVKVVAETLPTEIISDYLEEASDDFSNNQLLQERISSYMDKTRIPRKIEESRVNEYISQRRIIQNEMYDKSNTEIFNSLNISKNNILFSNLQAPVYIVNLTSNEIKRAAKNANVVGIYHYYSDLGTDSDLLINREEDTDDTNSISRIMNITGINRAKSEANLTGNNIKVGMIDADIVNDSNEFDSDRVIPVAPLPTSNQSTDPMHANDVAKTIAGNSGIANHAKLYSAYWIKNYEQNIPNLIAQDVHLINISAGLDRNQLQEDLHYSDAELYYTPIERYFDFISYNKRVLIVKSAGNNQNKPISIPGLSYNILTVGAYYSNGTSDFNDDTAYSYSYQNGNGCSKPDVIAPMALTTQPGNNFGTSYAAPVVTGTIALLYELSPSLKIQPETVKAIILASCHRKVTASNYTENIFNGITDHQGAGAFNPYLAIAIAASGNYGVRTMNSNSSFSVKTYQPSYNSNGLNISGVWTKPNVSENNGNYSSDGTININLSVTYNSSQTKSSNLSVSSTEMVYLSPSTNNNYLVNVTRTDSINKPVRFAYAFSVDKYRYQFPINNVDRIAFLKNYNSNQYLNYVSTTSVGQTSNTSLSSSKWLIYNNKMTSIMSQNLQIAVGSVIDSSTRKVTLSTTNPTNIYVINNAQSITTETGDTFSLPTGTVSIVNNNYVLTSVYNSSTNCYDVVWKTFNPGNITNQQKWFIDTVGYQRGDYNLDGLIDSADALKVLRCSVGLETPTKVQEYLADVDGNGSITSNDASLINSIYSGEF